MALGIHYIKYNKTQDLNTKSQTFTTVEIKIREL